MRRLRVLLALALVPVVVFSTPAVAEAASNYSSPVTSDTIKLTTRQVYSELSCKVTAYYQIDGTAERIKYKASCSKQLNASFDGEAVTMFTGINANGDECALADDSPFSEEGKTSGTALLGGAGLAPLCVVGEVCMSATTDHWFFGGREYSSVCAGLDLGDIPTSGGGIECQYGTVTKPAVTAPTFKNDGDRYTWVAQFNASVAATQAPPAANDNASQPTPTYWQAYTIAKPGTEYRDGYNYWFSPKYGGEWVATAYEFGFGEQDASRMPLASGTAGDFDYGQRVGDYSFNGSQPPASANAQIIGVGIFLNTNGAQGRRLPVDSAGGGDALGLVGVSDPGACAFYWGPKLFNESDSTRDDPIAGFALGETDPDPGGGGSTDPDPEGPDTPPATGGCDFSITDPASWLSGGMCALVGLMSKVLDVLGDLVGAVGDLLAAIGGLAGALLDGLVGLFVPDAGAISAEVQGVQDAWAGTTIAKWKDAFIGQTFTFGDAGCGGVPVDLVLPGDVAVDMKLGEACSGSLATAASIVKLCVTAGLVIFGGIACVRALGSGFGWNPGIGKGEA